MLPRLLVTTWIPDSIIRCDRSPIFPSSVTGKSQEKLCWRGFSGFTSMSILSRQYWAVRVWLVAKGEVERQDAERQSMGIENADSSTSFIRINGLV